MGTLAPSACPGITPPSFLEPIFADLAWSEPVSAAIAPVVTEPVVTEPVVTEPVVTEPVPSNLVAPPPIPPEPASLTPVFPLNRVYVSLGSNERLVADKGVSRFFAQAGGNNTFIGGEGPNQFWIGVAENPVPPNIITNFKPSTDVLGLVGLGLVSFDRLSLVQQGADTQIAINERTFAILQNVQASSLGPANFVMLVQGQFGVANDLPGAPQVPIFGTIASDSLQAIGTNQLVFAGRGLDVIDAVNSAGGNQIFAGTGDDTLIVGKGDRLLGNEGNDRFLAQAGGGNTFVGGAGVDWFWIAVGEIPTEPNLIEDFNPDSDVLGVAGIGVTSISQLEFTQDGADTRIAFNSQVLAIVRNVSVSSFTSQNMKVMASGLQASEPPAFLGAEVPLSLLFGTTQKDVLTVQGSDQLVLAGAGDDLVVLLQEGNRVFGGTGNDMLLGGFNDDVLNGGDGQDFLSGDFGNDTLDGGTAMDVLAGGAGDDILIGGQGEDVITTSTGSDRIVYRSILDGGDLVSDFDINRDVIDVSRIFGVQTAANSNAFQDLIKITQGATGAVVQIEIPLEARGTSPTGLVTLATLANVTAGSLTSRNFLFGLPL